MLTEAEKDHARKLWAKVSLLFPEERLMNMYATALMHMEFPEEAEKAAEQLGDGETAEGVRDKAEFTIELIKETLAERGLEVEVITGTVQ